MTMKKESIAIYIATHKEKIENMGSCFIPLQVGAAKAEEHFEQVCDDTGDHISDKNASYCELTGLYWIWKNDTSDIVGLEHYRRRFEIKEQQIGEILKDYDIIVPPAYQYRISLDEEYRKYHVSQDWDHLLAVLREDYPEYDMELQEIFDANRLVPYNMFVTKRKIVDDYCKWLFEILKEVECRHVTREGDAYQERYLGFLSERLFTLYITQKNFKVYTCKVTNSDQNSVWYHCKYWIGQHVTNPLIFHFGRRSH